MYGIYIPTLKTIKSTIKYSSPVDPSWDVGSVFVVRRFAVTESEFSSPSFLKPNVPRCEAECLELSNVGGQGCEVLSLPSLFVMPR